jgi:hypothetical protein
MHEFIFVQSSLTVIKMEHEIKKKEEVSSEFNQENILFRF